MSEARVVKRINPDSAREDWGYDCERGFAPLDKREQAEIAATSYNNGDTEGWAFYRIEDCPLVEDPNAPSSSANELS